MVGDKGAIARPKLERWAISFPFALISALAVMSAWPRPRLLIVCVLVSAAAGALCAAIYAIRRWLRAWMHWVAGLCLAPVPVATWVAAGARLELAPLLLAGALLFWVAGFDIIYACDNAQVDRERGIFTVAARWGARKSLLLALLNHVIALWLLAVFGWIGPVGWLFLVGVIVISFGVYLLHRTLRPERFPGAASSAALMSLVLSLILLAFTAAAVLVIGGPVLI